MMLLQAQHALKEPVAGNDTKKTEKRRGRYGANSTKQERPEVESDSNPSLSRRLKASFIISESHCDHSCSSATYVRCWCEEGFPVPPHPKEKVDSCHCLSPCAPKHSRRAQTNTNKRKQAQDPFLGGMGGTQQTTSRQ